MTTKVWTGGTGSFNDPADWSPAGVPGHGDVAVIQTGTAIARMQLLDGFELQLQSPASVLDITDVTFGRNFTLTLPPGAGGAATVNATGFNANDGVIQLVSPETTQPSFSPPFTINMSDLKPSPGCAGAAAVFLNNGTILDETGQPFAILAKSSDAVLINNGLMHLDASFMQADIGVSVLGTGTIETGHEITPAPSALLLASVPVLTFGGAVGSGQSLVITGTAYIEIDQPLEFHAVIHGFEPLASPTSPPPYYFPPYEPRIVLENSPVTSYAVSNDVLTLWNGHSVVAQLHFADFAYTRDNFLVTTSGTTTTVEPQGILVPMGVAPLNAAETHSALA